ncbi:acyl-CoA thioester hydrolase [Alicyclobacillus sacchari]|uniref:Acyl-CoA thioester hydrolase n=1 Tax=Alicyclobacillus sacchari TaxID=392010 RepID=A0A4R8LUW7_9BACL|nr:thioesterase family protein [Alicyclobacillus sacchari]TDY51348.1 acyl-CoA thioester hydrolase [Alicyclobacillus sacchari]GMA56662.1 thioesterase [Alicyclobacillus sacchari]
MEGFRFHYDIRVRWPEVDGQLIVYNANYLMYLDLAFQEFFRHELKLYGEVPTTVLAKTTLQYHKSARFEDDLSIWVRTNRIGNTSIVLDFAITRQDELIFEAQSIYVHVDGAGTPSPVPDDWRAALTGYEQGEAV